MKHINDYLSENLDTTLNEKAFNEVDFSLLSQLSYLDLEDIVSSGAQKISFADAYKIYKEKGRVATDPKYDELFMKVANSTRYKNLKLSHFMQVDNPETLEQFGAYCLDISLYHKAMFFRPTNDYLYAWKENFSVMYKHASETQLESAKYFNNVAKMHPFQRFTLCGHSKGGNNAMYAATGANLFNQTKIKQIINFDGPGFNHDLNEGITNANLASKVTTYVPEGSIIGRLLDHNPNEKVIIVKGDTENGTPQHDMNEWLVGENGFERAEKFNYKSDLIDNKFREIIDSLSLENREQFINGLFDILSNTNYTKLSQVLEKPRKLFHAYFKSDRESRTLVRDVVLNVLRDRQFMKAVMGKKLTKDIEKYVKTVTSVDKDINKAKDNNLVNNEVVNHNDAMEMSMTF